MATSTNNRRTPEEVRREIEVERDQLATSVDHLRAEVAEVTDIGSKIRARLPIVAAGALGAGFFLAGGVGATMRLLARRGREGRTKARVGRFSFVDRD
jgi:hypothetical protein